MSSQNKLIARRFIEEVLGQGALHLIEEITTPDYIDHNLPAGVTPGQSIAAFRSGFPGITFTVEDQMEDGDKVVTRWLATGEHTGNLYGIPPTHKKMTLTGISIYRVANNKIVGSWVEYDRMSMMQQLGVVPV